MKEKTLYPDVCHYLDYRSYLRDFVRVKRSASRGFSIRQFCLKANISTDNYLSRILKGQKNLGPKIAEKFLPVLGLKGLEAKYFMSMVQAENAKTTFERQQLHQEMQKIRKRKKRPLPITDNLIATHWYFAVILELASCAGFNLNPKSAVSALGGKISIQEAKEAIDFLVSKKYLIRKNGKWTTGKVEIKTTDEKRDAVVRLNHRETIEAALKAVDLPLDQRCFRGLTIAIHKDRLSEVRARIKNFMEDLQTEFANDTKANTVYRINSHCYPVAKSE